MPQLDFSTFLGQILWLLFAFIALFCMVKFLFVPQIESRLQLRSHSIKADLAAAELAMNEVKAIRSDLEKEFQKTRDEAHSMHHEAETSIKNMLEAKSVEAESAALVQLKAETHKIELWYENEMASQIPRIADELKQEIVSLMLRQLNEDKLA